MLESIAMWGGIAGIVIAIFAIAILYLTRSNIIDLLDRDVVMYDKNYETKKDALEKAFNCLDMVSQNGLEIKNSAQYSQKAKEAYNALLCTVTSAKLYQEFYRLAVDNTTSGYSIEDIEKFKISCREELISKQKMKKESFKGTTSGSLNESGLSAIQTPIIPSQSPVQPRQQVRPLQQQRHQQAPTHAQPHQQAPKQKKGE